MKKLIGDSPFNLALKILSVLRWFSLTHPSQLFIRAGILSHLLLVELFLALQFVNFFFYETFEDLVSMMALLPSMIALSAKSFNLLFYSTQLRELLQMTEELSRMSGKAKRVKRRVATLDKVFKASLAAATALCLIADFNTINELPARMWLPFETKNNHVGYWAVAMYQCITSHCTSVASLCYDLIALFFLCCTVGFLETTSDNFEELCNSTDGKTSFKECVEFHLKVQTYFKIILETFSYSWFVQKAMSDLILCNVLYSLSMVS